MVDLLVHWPRILASHYQAGLLDQGRLECVPYLQRPNGVLRSVAKRTRGISRGSLSTLHLPRFIHVRNLLSAYSVLEILALKKLNSSC